MSSLSLLLSSCLSSVVLCLYETLGSSFSWVSSPIIIVFLLSNKLDFSTSIVKSVLVAFPSLSWQLESSEKGLWTCLIELRPELLYWLHYISYISLLPSFFFHVNDFVFLSFFFINNSCCEIFQRYRKVRV